MPAEPLRPSLIVWPDRLELHDRLARQLAGVMPVVLEQRQGDRRRSARLGNLDPRHAGRRRLVPGPSLERFRTLGYQLVYTVEAPPAGGGALFAVAFCGTCERVLEFEMPPFVEHPVRVEVDVEHVPGRGATAHPVQIEARTLTDQVLLRDRVVAHEQAR